LSKKTVVADASPLIAFGRINHLSLLSNTLGTIIIPQVVADECLLDIARPGAKQIQQAIRQKKIILHANPNINNYQELHNLLGEGETNAIVLALQLNTGLLIDEKLGRGAAQKLGLKIIGTAGVLLLAKHHRLINKISPLISELKQAGYYLSDALLKDVLKRAKEKN